MNTRDTWPRRTLRRVGQALLLIAALYFVGRAAVELVIVNPTQLESYRQDWGGPHYLGVLLVHVGPGVLVLVLAVLHIKRHKSQPHV